ncbi:toprim domain-containing protein [Stieleria neptunia]|nr:toprim domain-containing protein [Stieleria neptunia]
MVVCETAVDMLSLATVEGTENRRFFSTSGQFSSHQAECLRSAVKNMPSGATKVLLAFDHDDGGRQLASQIRDVIQNCPIEVVDYFPAEQGMDWNDVLRQTLSTGKSRLTPTL